MLSAVFPFTVSTPSSKKLRRFVLEFSTAERVTHMSNVLGHASTLASVLTLLSQVGGSLSVFSLSGLGHSHVDALQPLLGVFLILSFQHVRLTVCENLKGPRQAPIPPLLGHHLQTERRTMNEKKRRRWRKSENWSCSERWRCCKYLCVHAVSFKIDRLSFFICLFFTLNIVVHI